MSNPRVIVTGAAGLVGQNLILMLAERGYADIVAIDKHARNLEILRALVPSVKAVVADMAQPGEWEELFEPATLVFVLHAHITGKYPEEFIRNNIEATRRMLEAIKRRGARYLVHVSSSVVVSVAEDDYTRVITYILKLNGFPAGKDPLPSDSTFMRGIRIGPVADAAKSQGR